MSEASLRNRTYLQYFWTKYTILLARSNGPGYLSIVPRSELKQHSTGMALTETDSGRCAGGWMKKIPEPVLPKSPMEVPVPSACGTLSSIKGTLGL
jgi:hypothetical protein